nr:hypothetical protein [Tanacetum cinerariifolium]
MDTIPTPYDLPLTGGYTPGSDEGKITLAELMETCTILSNMVTQLETKLSTTKAVYNKAFITLTNKLKKLESQLKQKRSRAVIHSSDEEGPREVQETAEHSRDNDDETLTETLLNIKRISAKDKGKGIIQETELPKKLKKKEMIQLSLDEELAQKFYAKELEKEEARQKQERYNLERALELQRQLDQRKENVPKGDQAKEIDWNDPQNQGGYKQSYFKGMKYEDIRPLFERIWDQVHTFVPKDFEIEREVMKRARFDLQQGSSKKQRLDQQTKETEEEAEAQGDSDQEVEELKLYMRIIPKKDIAIEAIPLAIKPPMIIEEDLETLWKMVKDKYGNTRLEEGFERVLWGDLKVMFEPDIESEISVVSGKVKKTNKVISVVSYTGAPQGKVLGRIKPRSANSCSWSDSSCIFKKLICKVLGLLVPLLELNRFGIILGEPEEGQVASSGWPFVSAVPGQMTHLVASLTLDSARSFIVVGVFAIIKLSFVIIGFEAVTFPLTLLGDLVGFFYSNRKIPNSVCSNQRMRPTTPSVPLKLKVFAMVAACAFRGYDGKFCNRHSNKHLTYYVSRGLVYFLVVSYRDHLDNLSGSLRFQKIYAQCLDYDHIHDIWVQRFEKTRECIHCVYGDGKPITCNECEGMLRGGFCFPCNLKAENSYNAYSFNNNSNYLPQPQYENYLCNLYGNNSHDGYDCKQQFPFVYEQEPSYNQNYNDNYYPYDLPSFPCCDNCGGSHETFQCQPMDQNINFSGSDQIQTPQYPDVHLPSLEMNEEVFQAERELMKYIQTFLETFICIPFEEKPQILFQAWGKKFAIQYSKPENPNELFQKLLGDLKELAEYENSQSRDRPIFFNNDEDHSDQNKECFEKSSDEIATSNSNEEKEGPPQDFDIHRLIEECSTEVSEEQKQSMKDTMLELVKIYRQKELLCIHDNVDDLIESALNTKLLSINSQRLDKKEHEVKNIVEQPAERGNLAPILSTKEPEYSSSMGYEHSNTTSETESDEIIKSGVEELVPILSENEVTLEEKRECNVLSSEDSSTCDICNDHSDIFFDSKNDDDISVYDDFEDVEYVEASLPDPEIVSVEEENVVQQQEEEVDLDDISQIQDVDLREKLLSITRLISNIESLNDNPTPDCERLINVLKSDISDDSSNDPLLEEADLFLASVNTIPPGIENVANDSKGDIRFLKELLIDDSILSHESSDSNFEDNPSVPRPPPEPPDTKFDAGEEIPVVMNDKDKDVDYFSFMFVIFAKVFSLLSAESEDTIFDPGISV